MKAPVLTFANNRDGAGKASLIHHLAWMLASLNKRVIAVDLDPQMHLTSAFLDNEQVESILAAGSAGSTIHQCVQSLSSYGALSRPVLQEITNGLWFLPGDINLSGFEDELSTAWHRNLTHPDQYALRVLTALSQILQWAAADIQPDLLLVDLGPGLGALNRSGLFATDFIAIPLDSTPASLHGLRQLGAALKHWKQIWQTQAGPCPQVGKMQPIGYLYQQQSLLPDRQTQVMATWARQLPGVYRESMLGLSPLEGITPANDPECIGLMKNFRSLSQMAKEKRKPMFCLTPADGAIGCHASAAVDAGKHFRQLAREIAARSGVEV